MVPAIVCATSGAIAACRGSSFLIRFISVFRSACGALITIALLAGIPSERATVSETTASTPPIPTVPNPATGSFIGALASRPGAARFSGSLSSLPMVYETATPPLATFCHSRCDLAVGRAANARNADGSTPSIAVSLPFTRILAASTRSAATTPGSFRTAAAMLLRSVVGATTSRSAWSSRRSGATAGACSGRAGSTLRNDRRHRG